MKVLIFNGHFEGMTDIEILDYFKFIVIANALECTMENRPVSGMYFESQILEFENCISYLN